MTAERFSGERAPKLRNVGGEHRQLIAPKTLFDFPIIGGCLDNRVAPALPAVATTVLELVPMRRGIATAYFSAGTIWFNGATISALLVNGCSGGDEFSPAPTPRHQGSIRVSTTVTSVECPIITSYTLTPYLKAAGSDVALTSTTNASYGMRPVFLWSASSGSFLNADHADATYRCGAEVNPTIKLIVSCGSCVDSILIEELDCT